MNDYYRERLNLIMDKTNDLIWRMTMQRVDTPTAFKLWNDIENEYDEIMEEMAEDK